MENRKLATDREKMEDKVQKELIKREKLRTTFKGVVRKEKEKWEDQMVGCITIR